MITGAVLAGGKSRRYGRNKALEELRGKRLIDYGLEALRSLCDPVFVVVNDASIYRHLEATVIQDILPEQGPLGGIHTSLLFSPNEWVLVRATDMPFFSPGVASLMCEVKEGYDAVVPECNGLFEPLLALYHRRCIPSVAAVLEKGERKTTRFYEKVRVRTLREEEWRALDPEGLSFINVNTLEDMEKIEWSFMKPGD